VIKNAGGFQGVEKLPAFSLCG